MHRNCANPGLLGEKNGRGVANETAADIPRRYSTREISGRQEESAKKKPHVRVREHAASGLT
jgi:hypothetical protein